MLWLFHGIEYNFAQKQRLMKAAVLHKFGKTPSYEDFPDPIPGKDEVLIKVKAVALENFDRMVANGTHYSSRQFFPEFPGIPGHSGIGLTEDGQLVAFGEIKPPYGTLAEKVATRKTLPVPDGIDPAIAAVLPASILTSYLPLKYTAKLKKGETVLINGATGVSGKIAIQVAKLLGAGRIIASGRNEDILQTLTGLGADETINLKQTDDQLIQSFRNAAGEKGYDVVIDFIWGHPAEVLMKAFIPSIAGFAKSRIRYLHIGEKAGSSISLSGEMLRTSGLEIYGTGNIPDKAIHESLIKALQWIKQNKFQVDIEKIPLAKIEEAWQRTDLAGKRLVIIP